MFRVSSTATMVQKTILFYRIYNKQAPGYLAEPILTRNVEYQTQRVPNVPFLSFKHNVFKNTFFPSAVIGWKKIDPSL